MLARRALPIVLLAAGLVPALLAPAAPAGAGRPGSYPPATTRDCDQLDEATDERSYDVGLVYIHDLERCPSADEVTYWTGRMVAGMTRLQLAESVDRSSEATDLRAALLYDRAEVKDVDPDDVAAAAASFRTTRDEVPATVALLASDVFFIQHLDGRPPADWVDEAYRLVLDRRADEAAVEYYSTHFDLTTVAGRSRVLTILMRSAEHRRTSITLAYTSILHRQPDAGGLAHWDGWLRGAGRQRTLLLRSMILASDEAHAVAVCPSDC